MAKWEEVKGDYASGALKALELFEQGQIPYPRINLILAGEEANASRVGDENAKKTIHQIVEIIRDAVQQAGLKKRGMGFENVPVPPEVIKQIMAKIDEKGLRNQLKASAVREAVKGRAIVMA